MRGGVELHIAIADRGLGFLQSPGTWQLFLATRAAPLLHERTDRDIERAVAFGRQCLGALQDEPQRLAHGHPIGAGRGGAQSAQFTVGLVIT